MEYVIGGVIGLIVGAGVTYAVLLSRAGGSAGMALSNEIGRRSAQDPEFAAKARALLEPPPPPKPDGTPIRFLAILQQEGRLIDFLLEDISGASDEQVGAGVRAIHPKLRAALQEHLVLEPVLNEPEEATVTVPPGFDPSAVRLVGYVSGEPPFTGVLKHHGWRAKEIRLPRPPEGQDEMVLMPAEVEIPER